MKHNLADLILMIDESKEHELSEKNITLTSRVSGKSLGYCNLVYDGKHLAIEHIEVSYRKQGYGKLFVKLLVEKFPCEVITGFSAPNYLPFWKSFRDKVKLYDTMQLCEETGQWYNFHINAKEGSI